MVRTLSPLLSIVLLSACSILGSEETSAEDGDVMAGCREALEWPFAQGSIWNMPIGADAQYVPAGITPPGAHGMTDDEDILILEPDAPTVPVFKHEVGWSSGDRCGGRTPEVLLRDAPIPDDFSTDPGYRGRTPNHGVAILLEDGVSIWQSQPFHRCGEGGPAVSQYVYPNETYHIRNDDGTRGAHGGSGLSAIGGTIRVGELLPGSTIMHALKVNLYAEKLLYYATDEPDGKAGFRWPAIRSDGYAERVYGGTNPVLQQGSLLALKPDFAVDELHTEPARIIARALRDYGGYVVDDTAWDVYALAVEWGPDGRVLDEFERAWGFPFSTNTKASCNDDGEECQWVRDIATIFTSLNVIDNNAPSTIGGGGAPRRPLAPDFCE